MLASLYPVTTETPLRLSSATRELAARYLDGEFKDTVVQADFKLPAEASAGLSDDMRYALTVKLIAEKAPLRILPEEKLVGAATLLEAAEHQTPASDFSSTSHVTIGFNTVLQCGYLGLRQRLEQRLADSSLTPHQQDFLQSMVLCLDAARCWHDRHAAELERRIAVSTGVVRQHYRTVHRNMLAVPENPPQSFREAVQSLWLMFSFQRLCGNWSGLGRLDQMLGSYLERDLQNGTITLDEARELLAHFWIKGTEWRDIRKCYGGDAQNYQNVILGGIEREAMK